MTVNGKQSYGINFRDLQRMTVRVIDERIVRGKLIVKVDGEARYALSRVDSQFTEPLTGFRIGDKVLELAYEDYYRDKILNDKELKKKFSCLEDYILDALKKGTEKKLPIQTGSSEPPIYDALKYMPGDTVRLGDIKTKQYKIVIL